jgi:hypothetical protein
MNRICICGKELPYKTDQDKLFYSMYHSQCTDDDSAFDSLNHFIG